MIKKKIIKHKMSPYYSDGNGRVSNIYNNGWLNTDDLGFPNKGWYNTGVPLTYHRLATQKEISLYRK